MKKLPLLAFCFAIAMHSSAQVWKPVDMKKTIVEPKIAAANDGTLYIAGRISGMTASVVLSKFDGKALTTIYKPDFTKIHNDVSIGIGSNNLPVVAYTENGVAMVKQFDGSNLIDVCAESPAPKGFNYYKMYTDKAGVPYVFYTKDGFFYAKKLENGAWNQLVEGKGTGDFKVVFDSKNAPLIAFKEKRFVKRIEDGALIDIAPSYYPNSISEYTIAIDKSDTVYMSYGSFENGDMKIVKLAGQVWKSVSDPMKEYTGKGGELPVIAFDSNNKMYFSCSFRGQGFTAIRKFEAGRWAPFQNGIDEEDIKAYGVGKEFVITPSNKLFLSRPFFGVQL